MGHLFDAALPYEIKGDRFWLTREMVQGLCLPVKCSCSYHLRWDYMGIVISSFDGPVESRGYHRLQTTIHRSMKPGNNLDRLDPALCSCITEHRNDWDMVFAGCEPLLDRWQAYMGIK